MMKGKPLKGDGGGMGGGVLQFKFDEVLEVLKSMKYDHNDEKVFDACFKNWDDGLLNDEKGLMAALIRLAFFSAISDIVKRLNSDEFDMRDVLIFLMSKGLGLDKLSQAIEVAEKGLEALYEEGDFNVLYVVLDKMFEMFAKMFADQCEGKEVMLQ
jgi:hypothetical protein